MDEGDSDKDTFEKALQFSEILGIWVEVQCVISFFGILDTIVKEINDNGR